MINLPGDSGDYYLLELGVQVSAPYPGLTCELGVRRGGGTKVIMDAIAKHCPNKVHIGVDPYGNIEYEHKEGRVVQLDYTNDMRDDCMVNLYQYARHLKIPFIFFNMEDTEFFKRFADGIPVYNGAKRIESYYSMVHFDGPHAVAPLLEEISFFLPRTTPGGAWCFDDVKGYYDHDRIEAYLFPRGYKLIEKTHHKALYQFAP